MKSHKNNQEKEINLVIIFHCNEHLIYGQDIPIDFLRRITFHSLETNVVAAGLPYH